MGKLLDAFAGAAPSLIGDSIGMVRDMFQRRSERKMYEKMLRYNSPKAQMQRYSDAGLSPYLIYGAANAGNAQGPAPTHEIGTPSGGNIQDYLAVSNFKEDIRQKQLNNRILDWEARAARFRYRKAIDDDSRRQLDNDRKLLELLTDYPQYDGGYHREGRSNAREQLGGNLRQKAFELKRRLNEATMQRIATQIEGMKSDNKVKRMKGIFADELGMTGESPWSIGMGLFRKTYRAGSARSRTSARPKR